MINIISMSIASTQKIETSDISLMIYDQRWDIKLFALYFSQDKILVYNIKYKIMNRYQTY